MTTTTQAPVDPRVELNFAHKERQSTCWIEGEYPVQARPEALFAAFEQGGWTLDPVMEGVPAYEPFDLDPTRPSGQQMVFRGHQIKEFCISKPGTGLFSGWTDVERRTNLAEATAILARFGFRDVPVWAKTLADLV